MSDIVPTGPSRTPARFFRGRRVFLPVAAVALLILLAYVAPAWIAVRSMTTESRVALSSAPSDLGLAYENVEFPSRDGITLRGWWIQGSGDTVVIMTHGKGSVRDDAGLGFLNLAAGLVRAGHTVLTFDLRGHGESDFGRFTIGVNEPRDVLGALDFARSRGVPAERVALLGFSTGAVASLEAAVREPSVAAVIADGAWPNLRELLDQELANESPLPSFYNPGIYLVGKLAYGLDVDAQLALDDTREIVASGRPVFFIHGSEDRYTSVERAARFAAVVSAAPNSEYWQIDGAEHVTGYANHPEEYLNRVLAFLSRAFGAAS